ncbi:G2-specific protein kinase nim-1 [Cladorrhinum samala]|uniref:non-specific serine/threonine protein kinase n=1 Tax=Cladorrhinum samala TaxID=585594 RepID=A0AAV9I0P3_9PEZI|nr:G2-specific protein kinase nim-1 [Cladorrhinum samala]
MSESDKYDVLEKIGHGSFGVIRKVRRKVDGMVLCRKEISYLKMSQKEREQLHAEFQILSTLRHPNIVGYYHREHLKASQDLHLYMEYCGNGDLGRVIRGLIDKNQYAEESFVWSIFSQLVTALYRCHYGVDPPEVGKAVLGLGTTARPKAPTGGMTILHRDLKPENVFLGEDNSVKLGDFGLSKVMQSHDFASTYVGTPFYMSPEICAAEKYTLKSDIWSLGCIIYELCTREPPFNAKTHFQLVQKIKDGKIAPLPTVYSTELFAVIKDCLRVNPDRRPDTAALLNLPIVRLMRKEKEVADFSKTLKAKEEALNRRIREVDQKLATLDHDKVAVRQEIDATLRREWEVKARLEIDRLVNLEIEQLKRKFEEEVSLRVEARMQARLAAEAENHKKAAMMAAKEEEQRNDLASSRSDYQLSSIGCASPDEEFPSTTDLTELSTHSPDAPMQPPAKGNHRTPFVRAQTMFAVAPGTPMDVEMASPSPPNLAPLSLSPRRNAGAKGPAMNPSNIFTANQMAANDGRWDVRRNSSPLESDAESDDDVNVPSPTRMIKSSKNPFTSKQRPQLQAQKSMPVQRLQSKQTFVAQSKTASNPDMHALRAAGSNSSLQDRTNSPRSRLSKIPSTASLNGKPGSATDSSSASSSGNTLSRRPSLNKKDGAESQPQVPTLNKVSAPGKTNIRGRTLVELQQARAGGRPLSAVMSSDGGLVVNTNISPVRPFREHAAAANRGPSEPEALWDLERDGMPSPYVIKRKPIQKV